MFVWRHHRCYIDVTSGLLAISYTIGYMPNNVRLTCLEVDLLGGRSGWHFSSNEFMLISSVEQILFHSSITLMCILFIVSKSDIYLVVQNLYMAR